MKNRILVVTGGHLCRNPRALKAAVALTEKGFDTQILYPVWNDDFAAIDAVLCETNKLSAIPLDLRRNGKRGPLSSFLERSRIRLAREGVARLGIETAAALGPASLLLQRAQENKADLTIVHTELPLWIGVTLLSQGRRVAVDLEDWHSEDLLPEDRVARPVRLLAECERDALQRAAFVTTTSLALVDALHQRYGAQRAAVVTNSFPLQPHPRSSSRIDDRPPALVWFSQTIGPGRGLQEFLGTWSQTAVPSTVTLIGTVAPEFRQLLCGLVSATKQPHLNFRNPVTPEELPTILAGFDLGLALENCEPHSRNLTITNKILQFLNAGLGIIATRTLGQQEVAMRARDAVEFIDSSDHKDGAARLDRLFLETGKIVSMQHAARSSAESHFNWERESMKLIELVATELSRK